MVENKKDIEIAQLSEKFNSEKEIYQNPHAH